MRIRLQLLLPIVTLVLVGGGFVITAGAVGDGVHDSLMTVPGVTRDRAVQRAVHMVVLSGIGVTAVAVLLSGLLARLVARPLSRLPRTADQLTGAIREPRSPTAVAEVRDAAAGIDRAAAELRERHDLELRERSDLALLVDAASEGIVQVDGEGRIVRVNRAGRGLLGMPPDAEGRPIASLVRNEQLRLLVARGVAGGSRESAELAVDELRLLVTVAPRPEGGALVTATDLTELRRLEEVRRDFVANASHELKTPLTSIRGYAETLRSGGLDEAQRNQFLETVARNAHRLQRIVDDLLDLSRLESGRWIPDVRPLRIGEAADGCWASFIDRAEGQRVSIRIEACEDDRALADTRALEQIFANLYDNALRYTPEGGLITVTTRVDDAGPPSHDDPRRATPAAPESSGPRQGWIRVEVSDTGAGIPRDSLPRIFERFYRVDPARSRAEGGTGLGLSIVRHMVESMGGGVQATSTLGKGTTIRFWLPRAA